jgi:hypothetical protein
VLLRVRAETCGLRPLRGQTGSAPDSLFRPFLSVPQAPGNGPKSTRLFVYGQEDQQLTSGRIDRFICGIGR